MATTLQQEGEEEAPAEACDAVLVLSLGYHLPSSPAPSLPSTKRKLQEPKSVEPSLTLALSDDPYAGKKVASEEQSAGSSSFSTVKEEAEIERVSSRQRADVDEEDGTTARKKLRLTREQSALLEERFREQSTLNPKQKLILAKQLNLRPRQVEVWFQNRRARTKLKQTEVDCEFLKRCCETLTDENRRLQRELQELRAVKFTATAAGPLYMQIPSTAITMCPSCQSVTTDGTSKGAVVAGQKAPHLYQHFSRSPSAAC